MMREGQGTHPSHAVVEGQHQPVLRNLHTKAHEEVRSCKVTVSCLCKSMCLCVSVCKRVLRVQAKHGPCVHQSKKDWRRTMSCPRSAARYLALMARGHSIEHTRWSYAL